MDKLDGIKNRVIVGGLLRDGPCSRRSPTSDHLTLQTRSFQRSGFEKIQKTKRQTEEQRREAELKLDVGDEPNSWCFSFFFNIYLINQLPTACCGGFGRAAALSCSTGLTSPRRRSGPRPTLVQYCNMCALKPCQRIVTYCVMPFVFCSVLLGGQILFFSISVFLYQRLNMSGEKKNVCFYKKKILKKSHSSL